MSDITTTPEARLKMAADLFGLKEMPCLDREQVELLQVAAGDCGAAFFDDLIKTFQSESAPRIERLERECGAKNLPEIRRHCHFVAGSAANIGLERLSKLCRNIEKQCDEGTFTAFDTCVPVVRSEMSTAVKEIRALLAV